jgi:hypothetical protein
VLQHTLSESGFVIEVVTTNRAALAGMTSRPILRATIALVTTIVAPLIRLASLRKYPGDPVAEVMREDVLLRGEDVILRARRVDHA